MNPRNHAWKEVPLPERMRSLPTDSRGYPIPANILRDENGVYHFIINDENKRQEQIELQNCEGRDWFKVESSIKKPGTCANRTCNSPYWDKPYKEQKEKR
jgi:hypothetical protein